MSDEEIAKEIGSKIRRLRLEKSLSQKRLADKLGHERPQVARIEKGKHLPTLRTLIEYSRVLECRVVDLIPADV